MKRILLIFSLIFFAYLLMSGENSAILKLDKDSRLVIHASTNLLNFTLNQSGDKIQNNPVRVITNEKENKIFVNQNNLVLKVSNFESENPIAKSEFYKMMQIHQFPTLKIFLHHFEMTESSSDKILGNAKVSFTITGVTKTYIIPVLMQISDNKLIIDGKKKMTIRDFGIEPPVTMLGLIRVNEWIEINFNLICNYSLI